MKHLILTIMLIFGATAVSAYFDNREEWINSPDAYKEPYLAGLFWGLTTLHIEDSASIKEWKQKTFDCMTELEAKSSTFLDMMDNYYSDMSNWKQPVAIGFYQALNEVCSTD